MILGVSVIKTKQEIVINLILPFLTLTLQFKLTCNFQDSDWGPLSRILCKALTVNSQFSASHKDSKEHISTFIYFWIYPYIPEILSKWNISDIFNPWKIVDKIEAVIMFLYTMSLHFFNLEYTQGVREGTMD